MSKWIDADALAYIVASNGDADFINKVTRLMIDAPSIDIVRCAVCKHRTDSKAKSFCEKWLREVDAEVFCSYGERREP